MEFREKGVILLVLQLENNYLLKNFSSLRSSRQGFSLLNYFFSLLLYVSTSVELHYFRTTSLCSIIHVFLGIFNISVETLRDDLFVRYGGSFYSGKGARVCLKKG